MDGMQIYILFILKERTPMVYINLSAIFYKNKLYLYYNWSQARSTLQWNL